MIWYPGYNTWMNLLKSGSYTKLKGWYYLVIIWTKWLSSCLCFSIETGLIMCLYEDVRDWFACMDPIGASHWWGEGPWINSESIGVHSRGTVGCFLKCLAWVLGGSSHATYYKGRVSVPFPGPDGEKWQQRSLVSLSMVNKFGSMDERKCGLENDAGWVTDMQQRNLEHVSETGPWDSLTKGNADW